MLSVLLLGLTGSARAQIFTDWTSIDTTNRVVSGTLGSTSVTFTWTAAGDVPTTWLGGNFTGFAFSAFTPAPGTSDAFEFVGNASSPVYTINFGAPVTNPILQIASNASTLTFSGATPELISGDVRFGVSSNMITGAVDNTGPTTDGNGTVRFSGTYSSLTFTAHYSGTIDGISLQVGAIPEPATNAALGGIAALSVALMRRRRRAPAR